MKISSQILKKSFGKIKVRTLLMKEKRGKNVFLERIEEIRLVKDALKIRKINSI